MADPQITLTADILQLVNLQIASGRFETPAQVVGAALLALQREEETNREKLLVLRAAIQEGLQGEILDGDVISEVLEELGLSEQVSA